MTSGMGRESQLDLLPSACQRMYRAGAAIPRGWSNMGGTPEFSRYQVSMMDCKNLVMGKAVYSRGVYRGPASLQKGGHAWSRRRAVIGLDHKTGPHTKEVWIGKTRLVVQQGFDLSWVKQRTSIECIKLWLITPCSVKELRTRQKRSSMKF
jgi:hypothetical protein